MSTAQLAHQGGWDEILMVVGPILLIVGVLAVVKRRVDRGFDEGHLESSYPDPVEDPVSPEDQVGI